VTLNMVVQKLGSLLASKLFMHVVVYSYAVSIFKNRHKWVSIIPFSSKAFGFFVASVFIGIVTLLSVIEPIVVLGLGFYGKLGAMKIHFDVSLSAHHLVCAVFVLALFLWFF